MIQHRILAALVATTFLASVSTAHAADLQAPTPGPLPTLNVVADSSLGDDAVIKGTEMVSSDAVSLAPAVVAQLTNLAEESLAAQATLNAGTIVPEPAFSKGFPVPLKAFLGYSTLFTAFHPGIDIRAPYGTPIAALLDGVVQTVGFDADGYGNFVILEHHVDGHILRTLYAHMRQVFVKEGDSVKALEKIGEVGMTGHTTGPHVHFEVHDEADHAINPVAYLHTATTIASAQK